MRTKSNTSHELSRLMSSECNASRELRSTTTDEESSKAAVLARLKECDGLNGCMACVCGLRVGAWEQSRGASQHPTLSLLPRGRPAGLFSSTGECEAERVDSVRAWAESALKPLRKGNFQNHSDSQKRGESAKFRAGDGELTLQEEMSW